jgi:hypothetical protein
MRARRRALLDSYVEQGQAVVFVDGRVATLSPLATAVLLAVAPDWTETHAIAAALTSFDPPPDDDGAALRRVLDELAGLGVVELDPA